MENQSHKIDMTFYDNVTIKQIREMMNYALAPEIDMDLDDEIYITMDFLNLDEFLAFFNKFAKYIKTVWDETETGVKFHDYV